MKSSFAPISKHDKLQDPEIGAQSAHVTPLVVKLVIDCETNLRNLYTIEQKIEVATQTEYIEYHRNYPGS